MLRTIGMRGWAATALIGAFLLVAATPGSATAGPGSAVPRPSLRVDREGPEVVTILGVDRDPRFGRAWLLARLSSNGHLRTVSNRLKAFAPPGEFPAGFVRIPLIPKRPIAKLLRLKGQLTATVKIYFVPPGETAGTTVSRKVLLARTLPEKTAPAHH